MSLGGQTVTFVSFTQGATPDSLGIKTETAVEVAVAGCVFEPLRADETPQTEVDIATQVWRCTAPPVAAALNADATGLLKYNGETFQIVGGARPVSDFSGAVTQVVVLAQRQVG